jgi:hypothetical protein
MRGLWNILVQLKAFMSYFMFLSSAQFKIVTENQERQFLYIYKICSENRHVCSRSYYSFLLKASWCLTEVVPSMVIFF